MYVTIESLFCSYCDEVAEIFLRLIDTILLASDENELRQGIENLRTRAPLDDYFGKHGKIDPVGTDEIDPVKTA